MSYLDLPRLTFAGRSYANASTANNNDIASVYDIDKMKLNPQMALMSGGQPVSPPVNPFAWSGTKDNPALRNWLMGLANVPIDEANGQAQMAHWNYYGDHNTEFRNARVTDVMLSSGTGVADDPIRNVEVELLGDIFYGRRRGAVLVDVDPYALITSQVFAGRLQLTYQVSEKVSVPLLAADNPTVAYSYFINPYKNLNPSCTGFEPVSAVFQFGLPNAGLQFYEGKDVKSSPALAELRARAQAGQGLMVRFCLYDAIFEIQAPELHQDFAKGKYVSNPYVGRVLGSIGVWKQGELASAPPGRKLRNQISYSYTPPLPELSAAELAKKRARMASVAKYRHQPKKKSDDAQKTASVGVTLAQVDRANARISLDCISTFPEMDITARNKFDMGKVELRLLYGPPGQNGLPAASVTIGSVPYAKQAYESGGGVVDVSYARNPDRATIEANLDNGQLAIYSSKFQYLLTEPASRDTQTDDRAVYFDAKTGSGTNAVPGTSQIQLQVLDHGRLPTAATTLNLEYWMCAKDYVNPDKPQVPVVDRYFSVAGAKAIASTRYTLGYLGEMLPQQYPGGVAHVLTDQITVPAGGKLTLNLTALRPGVSMIRFVTPNPSQVSPNFAWDNCDFAVVRILPFDDYSGYTDAQINSWEFIYQHFFSFYSVIYPVMSKVIPWGPDGAPKDPEDVKNFHSHMVMLTDAKLWRSTLYMPITRDLSGGKRELLRRWCNLQ